MNEIKDWNNEDPEIVNSNLYKFLKKQSEVTIEIQICGYKQQDFKI